MLRIGDFPLSNNVFLAPMAGIADLPFRKLCRTLGTGMVIGEMTSARGALRHSAKSKLRGVHLDEPEPRAVQIVGWDASTMAEAARYNVDQGASIIDINMGCPAKKVCNKYAGSALLADEKQVAKILETVVKAVSVPVSLKIRTGPDPTNRNGVTIARIAESSGISHLAVHGRTRTCKYKGHAEYRTIKKIKASVSIPIIVNGDLDSIRKIQTILAYTNADGVMIGRAAQGAPWFPGQIAAYLESEKILPDPSIESQRRIVIQHLIEIHSFYGPDRGVRIARKHIKSYVDSFPGATEFRKLVNAVDSNNEQIQLVSDFYLKLQEYFEAA